MKCLKTVKGLKIMQLTARDLQFDPTNPELCIVLDQDGEEVSVGPDSLSTQMEFAKYYGQ